MTLINDMLEYTLAGTPFVILDQELRQVHRWMQLDPDQRDVVLRAIDFRPDDFCVFELR